jgi:hypothetical protein
MRGRRSITVFISAGLVVGGTAAAGSSTETAAAEWLVRPGPGQVALLDAAPGIDVELVGADGSVVRDDDVDLLGSLLFRYLDPGEYTMRSADQVSEPFTVPGFDEVPEPEFYTDQEIGPGFGYLTARDGTTLSVNVMLPGDPADGPYPTVVEYSGYDPSNPDGSGVSIAPLAVALGYAWVGVNMRGSGCSGGSFDYFEPIQATDGYDAIEAIAAQPWVQDNQVGMVGISWSGISQLYVAAQQPPSLLAITPISVVDSSALYTLYPGGILNNGFALNWAQQRDEENRPFGQDWSQTRIEGGDTTCRANQNLRLQNPGLERQIVGAEFYTDAAALKTDVRPLLPDIDVPVFLAGAWQDEQTGGHFANMLSGFTGTDHFYASLANGLHTESLSAGVAPRWLEFLDLYVGHRVPSLTVLQAIAGVLGNTIWNTDQIEVRADRFTEDMTYEEALAVFEADQPIELMMEEGAGGAIPLAPMPAFIESFDAWPVPQAQAAAFYLGPDGTLIAEAPTAAGEVSYVADPDNVPEQYFGSDGDVGNIWSVNAEFEWVAEPAGTAASFVSEPFVQDALIMGSGSADLWISSDAEDTDLEVTVIEITAEGNEVLIQSGWLRASHRSLDEDASTLLHPVQTHLEADAAPLPAGELVPVRVDIFPFAHPFREGSRLKITIDAPGGNRQIWLFDTISHGETVNVAFGGETPSRVVLSTLTGIDFPDAYPACGTLRGQPCRPG